MNDSKIRQEKQITNTWIQLSFKDDISDSLGSVVPYPHYHYLNKNNVMVYAWLLDGFFETKNNINYLNDIIARFKITFDGSKYIKHQKTTQCSLTPLKMRLFNGLTSRAKSIVKEKYQRAENRSDYVFWCIKLYCEDLIKRDGIIIYNTLETWAFSNFLDYSKDKSTLRAKCRSTYNWYFERDFELGRSNKKYKNMKEYQELTMATRKEQAIKMHTELAEQTKRKVLNVAFGMFKADYIKPNGAYNVSKIARDSGTSRNSVIKYLKEV